MIPKHAESGTGGIPRRAFNDPRALASLGSSNLSSQFAQDRVGRLSVGAEINGRRLPDPDARALVAGTTRAEAVLKEIRKDIRQIEDKIRGVAPDNFAKQQLIARRSELNQEVQSIKGQIKSKGYGNTVEDNRRDNPRGLIYVAKEYAQILNIPTEGLTI